ncbi:hypothetical protein R5W23_000299 [Gemmata sp. JC673]|uniref:Uncharacterized protein n=1 Tax=Gemmata algarum TaxID=2975278 RepID=A0ABU5EVI8_9BACT|nr:hypothetical protein [Gemmata algarum]MDY3559308.1 hypothetical protein [Gemmata algarum]
MAPLFPESWFAAGVACAESAEYFARCAGQAPQRPTRFWRWAAFRDWSEEREELTAEQCRSVYALGEADPDTNLGTALMCHALLRRRCPPELRARARESDRAAVRRTAALR